MKYTVLIFIFGMVLDAIAAPSLYDLELAEISRLDALADQSWHDAKHLEEVASLQARVREAAIASIGHFPERTPLEVQKVGEEQFNGYRVEKLIFASQPNFHVPCHLYLPDDPKFLPPYPAILMPCGHNVEAKSEPVHARAAVVAAQHGFAALLPDPIDEGERRQREGDKMSGIHGHRQAGLRAHLLGENFAMYRIWDGIRAIDLLLSRDDIDPKRIGCAGFSGGGTLTAYMYVFDTRIKCASPSAFITSIPEIAKGPGPQDSEQIIFGQLAFQLNHLGFLLMRAPSPILAGCSYDDFFPFAGSTNTLRKAKDWYVRRGLTNRLDHLECAGRHGWYESEKLGLVKWMDYWLNGNTSALPLDRAALNQLNEKQKSPELDYGLGLKTDPRALCCTGGNVKNLPGEKLIFDLLAEKAATLEKQRAPLTPEIVRKTLDINETLAHEQRPETIRATFTDVDGTITMKAEDAIFYDRGVEKFWYKLNGPGEELAVMMMWRGKNLIALRTADILRAAKHYYENHECRPMHLVAVGPAVIAAAHAKYLHPEFFSGIDLVNPPPSWKQTFLNPYEELNAMEVIHGAYKHYDWPDLL